ncbi:B12-binding domain-containing radical SAM protein, partial [Anaerosporobacter sp.]
MRVLLLTSNTNNSENPPLGLYLLKAYTEKYMEDRNITIDVHAFISFDFIKILKFILRYKPDVLGCGCYVWNCKAFQEICKKVKEIMPNITIIMGGPSISKNDLELDELLEKNIVKYMIVGEGERIFNEIILNIYDGEQERNNQLPNCMGKDEEGRIFKQPYDKEWRCDINTLPNPFYIYEEFREAALNYGCVTLETSRGCPYNCSYCVESQIPFYSKDISVVLNELEYLHNLGVKNIVVLDATLNFDINRTKDFFIEIIKKGWKFDFSFELKAECLDIDLMYMLTKIGVRKIEIGLQSSNKSTLKSIRRYFDEEKFVGNTKKLIELNIDIVVDLIAGLPNESLEDWFESIDYCYRLGDVNISSNLLKVLPGTEIYNQID